MRKSLRLALRQPTSLYKGGCFPQKAGRRVRVSLPFLHYTEKRYREKSRFLSRRRRRDTTGFHPSCSLCEQFILCPFLLRKKMDEEFESLCHFCIIQKKGTGKNPDTFPGAEGETRRVFTRRVRFANSLFYVPFCSAKRRTKSSSLSKQIHIYKKKKHKGKILVLFLAQKERLDGFSTRRVRFANSLFYVPFCSAKRWTKSSSLSALYCFFNIQKKGTGENPDTFLGAEGETRTLAPVTRPTPLAGAPRHQLEYFCIGSVYDTIRLLKERAEKPLSLLSGGESGIRTHGTLPYDGFQDRSVITTSVSLRIRRKL